ncbi:MAG: hypothetical protein ACRDHO_05710, partial [Actinomycetota bacterium]
MELIATFDRRLTPGDQGTVTLTRLGIVTIEFDDGLISSFERDEAEDFFLVVGHVEREQLRKRSREQMREQRRREFPYILAGIVVIGGVWAAFAVWPTLKEVVFSLVFLALFGVW